MNIYKVRTSVEFDWAKPQRGDLMVVLPARERLRYGRQARVETRSVGTLGTTTPNRHA